jgi:serine/threonine protein kinase
MAVLQCPACRKEFSVTDDQAGQPIRCPGCGRVIPAPTSVTARGGQGPRPKPTSPDSTSDVAEVDTGDLYATQPPETTSDRTREIDEAAAEGMNLIDFLAPPEADDELGRLGKYRILRVLGHGGMGVVYEAEDPRLKRSVAIKAMLPGTAASVTASKRFLLEAQAMAAVEHDHIIRIYQVDEDRGVPFLAMEFLRGESLDRRLAREPRLPIAEVLRIGRQVAEGLAAAHASGLIHRDIKPGNIWLESKEEGGRMKEEGGKSADSSFLLHPSAFRRVKILDFGLARATAQGSGLTQQGAVIGTPSYMAPEQARGQPVDFRCDLFSLGVVLYRLTTAQLPFRGTTAVSMLMAVATHDPAPPIALAPEVPKELSDLVMQLLEKEPARRPASAAAVAGTLEALEDRQRQRQVASPPAGRRAAPRRRWLACTAVAVLGLLALAAAGGIVLFWPTPHGTVRIEVADPDIRVVIDKDALTIQGAGKQDITLRPGEHDLNVKRGDLAFETDKFILRQGETVTLRVELLNGKVQVVQDGKVIGQPLAQNAKPVEEAPPQKKLVKGADEEAPPEKKPAKGAGEEPAPKKKGAGEEPPPKKPNKAISEAPPEKEKKPADYATTLPKGLTVAAAERLVKASVADRKLSADAIKCVDDPVLMQRFPGRHFFVVPENMDVAGPKRAWDVVVVSPDGKAEILFSKGGPLLPLLNATMGPVMDDERAREAVDAIRRLHEAQYPTLKFHTPQPPELFQEDGGQRVVSHSPATGPGGARWVLEVKLGYSKRGAWTAHWWYLKREKG